MSAAHSHKAPRFRTSNTPVASQNKPVDLDTLYATQFTTAANESQRTTQSRAVENDWARSAVANEMNSAMFENTHEHPTTINPAYTQFPAQHSTVATNRL